ncbi:CatA-like O-acetyltransferase [Butyrivibrio sp. INlla14]|uniref:CatA-like O-acetyltransferase n=1 Tax=Butyrivibrio sp. INlla14 TaxID=1520808 RepID=UPI000876C618|nr:CatA-like O-acetyltransferase [Butyrivibrio sp. INlla14]SCY62837.1 chloramphenicol O-acetyltransferase type A [Butyrivibrio sp. INlla14]
MKKNVPVKNIDMSSYARRAHFDYFRSLSYPYVGITVDVDVTKALRYSKDNNHSFYLTFLHLVALAADSIPEFRQRIHGDKIVEYSECPTSHIELLEDSSYCYCTLKHHMTLDEYFDYARDSREACNNKGIEEDENVESMYFISTVPWLHYSAIVQPVAGGDESNPRFTWGKYSKGADGSVTMPVTVLAHHALVDGIHLARFYDALADEIAALSR